MPWRPLATRDTRASTCSRAAHSVIDPVTALRLDGKVALVTGGTRGIGRAIAEAYAAAGASVAVLARKADELAETQAALGALGRPVLTVAGSAGDPAVIEDAVERSVGELGGLDIVVNNAATNPVFGPTIDVESRAVRKILEVNLEGPLHLAQAAWRAWMRDHGGVILNVASVGGLDPSPFIGAYNVSKAALIHLTRQLALELAPGVRVNALAPGLVKTDFARALWEPDEEGTSRRHPLGRIGVPDDVAALALFLASDAAAWITGEVYRLDGGLSLL
jgi:NAD(P)-dependent dehydrogenase (short-subunit alcohol dehydrogenase family)